ncbi:MAG: F0F1 ATP synthase subunit beta, partial [Thermacetogeniaceae bacterium]
MNGENYGHVVQIIGPVIDIEFAPGLLPDLLNAVKITSESQEPEIKATLTQEIDLTLEAMQHLGNNTVRCVAMSSTDGLRRGMRAYDTKAPIMVPVGKQTLGRLLNVLGQPIDELGAVDAEHYYPIHRPAPTIAEQRTSREVLETGIKVVDLLAPFTKGGKIGLFGGAGVGKTVIIQELIRNIA